MWASLNQWFWNTLQSLGLWNKKARILFLGLDNAGKTTLMHMLRDNRLVQHAPTRNPTSEEMRMGNIVFRTFDLGGHREARRLWRDYFSTVDGIVYLVDAADRDRFAETKHELDALLLEEDLKDTPICVLGNKIDKDGAVSEATLRDALGIYDHEGVFMCSIVERSGYEPAFQWLAKKI